MVEKCRLMHLYHAVEVAPLLGGFVRGAIAPCFVLVVNGHVWHLANPLECPSLWCMWLRMFAAMHVGLGCVPNPHGFGGAAP